jgi:hypothetical protein
MIPGGAAGCRLAAGARSYLRCFRVPVVCHLRVIDSAPIGLESRQYFPRIKHSIQPVGLNCLSRNNTFCDLPFCALQQYYR